MSDKIKKVSIIISKGGLDGVYPGLIMANGARMEGIEANLFFTFFGMDAVIKKRMGKIKIATVGNPGMHMPSLLGIVPGFSAMATKMMMKTMAGKDDKSMVKETGSQTETVRLIASEDVDSESFSKWFRPNVRSFLTRLISNCGNPLGIR